MPNLNERTKKKGLIAPLFFPFSRFIALIWETSVTLVTAKINIAVGMRATRVREKVQLSPPPLLSDTVIAQRNSAIVILQF